VERHDIATASDGIEALEQLGEVSPALILLDLLMPRMDGFAFVRELRRRAARLATASGVVGAGGPWIHLYGSIRIAGGSEDLTAEIRDPGPYQVDQPLVTSGRWLGEGGGVVLESGLAATLHAGPGDSVTIQGRSFPVRGVAQTVSRGRFPLARPAQVWVTPATAAELRVLGMTEEGFELQLRLADPNRAAAFVAAHESLADVTDPGSSVNAFMETWQQRRSDSHSDIDILAGTLFAAGGLIAVLTVATAAGLVAGRWPPRSARSARSRPSASPHGRSCSCCWWSTSPSPPGPPSSGSASGACSRPASPRPR
jgi:hypothetical protein